MTQAPVLKETPPTIVTLRHASLREALSGLELARNAIIRGHEWLREKNWTHAIGTTSWKETESLMLCPVATVLAVIVDYIRMHPADTNNPTQMQLVAARLRLTDLPPDVYIDLN